MNQKALIVVIDEWTAAVERLSTHAPPDVVEQLRIATGDLLEAFGTAAQAQATQFATLLREKVEADHLRIKELDARTDRRHADMDVEDERRQVNE